VTVVKPYEATECNRMPKRRNSKRLAAISEHEAAWLRGDRDSGLLNSSVMKNSKSCGIVMAIAIRCIGSQVCTGPNPQLRIMAADSKKPVDSVHNGHRIELSPQRRKLCSAY
jgi:hypothetical protein